MSAKNWPDDRWRVLDELCSRNWGFHGSAADDFRDWHLSRVALEFILTSVGENARTIETGAGHSTIVFALSGSRHTTVSHAEWEHDRIRAWCDERNVSTKNIEFIVGRSEAVLPSLGDEPIDFALIDGDHAFPVPFIDFYYIARRMHPGSVLLIDDTHIRTGRILRDFLGAERDRWRRLGEYSVAVAFERLEGPLLDYAGWMSQPYCARPRRSAPFRPFQQVRAALRVRTRLRNLVGRRVN